jgi:hypothetical protein
MTTPTPHYLHPRVGADAQFASVRRLVEDDGKGRGMRVIDVDTGSGLSFSVYPDRGMDIGRATYRGLSLAWLSCNGDVAPSFYDADGVDWLRTWGGGLLTGCGLSNVGGPVKVGGERHGLHGRLSHTPAEEVDARAGWAADGTYALRVSGRVRQSKVFGEKLSLTREIAAAYGSDAITVRDTVANLGFAPAPLMLLYHINIGWPFVDAGAQLLAADHAVRPQNEHAASGLGEWSRLTAPVPGFREQVYYHDIPPQADGLARIRLANPRLGLAIDIAYRTAELPNLIQWKMMGEGEYVLGLEPANCFPEGQERAAACGQLRQLAPGESVETLVKISVSAL